MLLFMILGNHLLHDLRLSERYKTCVTCRNSTISSEAFFKGFRSSKEGVLVSYSKKSCIQFPDKGSSFLLPGNCSIEDLDVVMVFNC